MVKDSVQEGAEIYTDYNTGYNQLKNYYAHHTVNRSKQGNTDVETTSRVESLWHIIKRNIHTYSTIRLHTLQKFLDEACWRIKFRSYGERNEFMMQILNTQR